MLARPDVDALLAGPLGAWLAEQGAEREAAKKKAAGRLFWGLMAAVVPLVALWVFVPFDVEGRFWGSAVVVAGIYWWSQGPKRAAIKRVKSGINDAIAEALGLSYECDIEPDATFELVAEFGLLPSYDRVSCEDRWSGTVGDRPFVLFEAHLEERRGSGKNRRWVTVFRGPIMSFGFHRRFHGTTIVQRAGTYRKFFGGRREEIEVAGRTLGYVDMVHPGFEDSFDIYSNDQVEARYLVHPVYIERLIALEEAFSGHDIRTLFEGGQLVVALENEDMFESGSIEASDDRDRLARTVDQFARMAELAAALNERPRE